MFIRPIIFASLALSFVGVPALHAQDDVPLRTTDTTAPPQPLFGPRWSLVPYTGYAHFNHYINGPIGASAEMTGLQFNLRLLPMLSFVANGSYAYTGAPSPYFPNGSAYANTNPAAYFPQGALSGPLSGPAFYTPTTEPRHATSGLWLFDGDLQFSVPLRITPVQVLRPFVQAGAGGMNYYAQNDLGSANVTNLVYNYGAGVDYPVSNNMGLRLMAKNYVISWNNMIAPTEIPQRTNNFAFTAGFWFSP